MIKSGVYGIFGPERNVYVGSSQNITLRWQLHINELKRGVHCNFLLQSDWTRYSDSNAFDWHVFEYCTADVLEVREQYYLDQYIPKVYNVELEIGKPASKQIELLNGRKFSSQSEFANYLETTPSVVSYLLSTGETPDSIVTRYVDGKVQNRRPVILNDGTRFTSVVAFADWLERPHPTINSWLQVFSPDEIVERCKEPQLPNRRKPMGGFKTMREFGVWLGISNNTIRNCLGRGMTIEQIILKYQK